MIPKDELKKYIDSLDNPVALVETGKYHKVKRYGRDGEEYLGINLGKLEIIPSHDLPHDLEGKKVGVFLVIDS